MPNKCNRVLLSKHYHNQMRASHVPTLVPVHAVVLHGTVALHATLLRRSSSLLLCHTAYLKIVASLATHLLFRQAPRCRRVPTTMWRIPALGWCTKHWLPWLQVDENTDFSKLKVTQLKQLMKDRGVSCPECVEKNDYVKRVRSLFVSGSSGEL